MKHSFLLALLLVSLALVGSVPAVAQSTDQPIGPQPTPNETENTQTDTERIDNQTTIVSSRTVRRGEQPVAIITLRSETVQTITLVDAGGFQNGGEIASRTVVFGAGETATIELPVTNQDGLIGVGITTENTIYAEILERPGGDGLDVLRALGSLQAWFAGISIAFIWMTIAGWSVLRGEDSRPEVA